MAARPIRQPECQPNQQNVGQSKQDANFTVMSPKHSSLEYRRPGAEASVGLPLPGVLRGFP